MKQNFNEIKQNWNFYMCRVDDKTASIRLNLALSNIAPVEDYKHRISIFIKMNNPTDDGLSSNEEYPMLCDIEDEVIGRLETLEDIFAGTVKTQGRLELYIFTKNPEKSEELCKEAFKKFPDYQWKSYIDEDREWDFYFNFLYPDVYSYHAIMNRSVIENLTNQGDNLEKEREIGHWLYFSSEENINIATKKLEESSSDLGYNTSVGVTITKDSFYTQIEPETKPVGYELINRWNSYVKGGAICTAMEEATLFLVASSLNARAASVLVSATDYVGKVSNDISSKGYPSNYIERAIRVGIESLRKIILEDRNAKTE